MATDEKRVSAGLGHRLLSDGETPLPLMGWTGSLFQGRERDAMAIVDEDLDGLDSLELWQKWVDSPKGRAREKLHQSLTNLRLDSEITISTLCSNFLDFVLHISPADPSADTTAELVEPLTAHFNRLKARANAKRKHAAKNKVRFFIETEWSKHKAAYDNNKSAFARDYSRRSKNEFGIDVTEKTIREVWLRDTLAASKQAG